MTLAQLLSPDRVIADLQATEHWPAIVELVDHLISIDSYPIEDRDVVLEAFRQREEERSTGIGGGVAIPHCFSDTIEEVTTVFGRSTAGVDFCSIDRSPVHFIVLFVVPRSEYSAHLKTLAAIAKQLNSADTRTQLGEADNASELYEILTGQKAGV
ncbi:PTS sugar transporter subunit IIA [bacterium]|jgi:mannitol/fructose-specific phosphotransferase system IIA component (Ntr-type)|nr:PTS sugar transporter subunit IIA [bacterium]